MRASELIRQQRTLRVPDHDLSGEMDADGRVRWWRTMDRHPGPVFPLAIVCLAELRLPGTILLQLRTRSNATSAVGRWSNVAGRVRLSDCLVADGAEPGPSPNERTFELAAVREVSEEIGLDLDTAWLRPVDSFTAPVGERWAVCRVYLACIDLSGEVPQNALSDWLADRSLRPYTADTLKDLVAAGYANTILAERLAMTFLPVFERLAGYVTAPGIAPPSSP